MLFDYVLKGLGLPNDTKKGAFATVPVILEGHIRMRAKALIVTTKEFNVLSLLHRLLVELS